MDHNTEFTLFIQLLREAMNKMNNSSNNLFKLYNGTVNNVVNATNNVTSHDFNMIETQLKNDFIIEIILCVMVGIAIIGSAIMKFCKRINVHRQRRMLIPMTTINTNTNTTNANNGKNPSTIVNTEEVAPLNNQIL